MKNTRIIVIVFALITLFWSGASCQDLKRVPQRVQKQLESASLDYNRLDLKSALQRLEKILRKYPEFAKAWLLRAKCEEELNLKKEACGSFLHAFLADSSKFHYLSYKIALLLFDDGQYKRSIEYLDKYQAWDGYENSVNMILAENLSKNLHFAVAQIEGFSGTPKVYSLEGVNSTALEYFPSVTIDGKQLVFTRQDYDSNDIGKSPGQEDLYIGVLNENKVSSITKLPEPLNSKNNEGTQTLRQDGRLMIFTACNRPDSKGGCDLYHSIKVNGKWTEPVNIGYPVNTRYWESTPCLGPDGRSLYFASNRPGGIGGMDIWRSLYDPETGWQEPTNLGSEINTPDDEISPFVHGDGKSLYFSSKSWISMGGFDIFISRASDDGQWLSPENLGYPINTHSDEFGITLAGSGEFAIFSSDRDSITNRDLYKVELPKASRPEYLGFLNGIIIDSLTRKTIGASVEIRNQFGELLQLVDSDPFTGEFLVGLPGRGRFSFVVRHPGYQYYSEYFNLVDTQQAISQHVQIPLLRVRKGDVKILQQVYFDFDSAELKPESIGEIQQIYQMLIDNPQIKILITGHTDSQGTEEYNEELSKNRARSIKEALIKQGVPAVRLKSSGAGSSQPVSDNYTEEGRALNRRTEIKII